jgi:hypothetical protein
VDDSTIELGANGLRVVDHGITTSKIANGAVTAAKLNADTAGLGLVQDANGALMVNVARGIKLNGDVVEANVDGSTIIVNSAGQLQANTANIGGAIAGNGLEFDAATGAVNITAGNGIDTSGDSVAVKAADGSLIVNGDGVAVAVDNSTVELGANGLQVVDQGITTAKLADDGVTAAKLNADTAGAGIVQDATGALQVNAANGIILNGDVVEANVDGSSIVVNSDGQLQANTTVIGSVVAGNALEYNAGTGQIDVTAGHGIVADHGSVAVQAADNSIVVNETGVSVAVDNRTVELGNHGLQVRNGGIGNAALAADSVTYDKLGTDVREKFFQLDSSIDEANGGISMAIAMANIPSITDPNENFRFGLGLGYFGDNFGYAAKISARFQDEDHPYEETNTIGSLSVAGTARGGIAVGAGLSWGW